MNWLKQIFRTKRSKIAKAASYADQVLSPDPPEQQFAWKKVDARKLGDYRSEFFPRGGPYPWLDLDSAEEEINNKLVRGEIDEQQAEACRYFRDHGYYIVRGVLSSDEVDFIWESYEAALAKGEVVPRQQSEAPDDPFPERSLDAHLKVPAIAQLLCNSSIKEYIRLFLGKEPKPFQTLTAHKGSQQAAHSDSIHMTTYPVGFLAAAWIAMEDIHPDSGPLIYYPGSHRLPYLMSDDVGISVVDFRKNKYAPYYEKYEPAIAKIIEEKKLRPRYFDARKGDVLFWHANLLHGGAIRKNLRLSRKSVVCHYFVKGAIAYHDLSGHKARPHSGTCTIGDSEYSRKRICSVNSPSHSAHPKSAVSTN